MFIRIEIGILAVKTYFVHKNHRVREVSSQQGLRELIASPV